MAGREGQGADGRVSAPAQESLDDGESPELLSPTKVLRYLDEAEAGRPGEEGGPLPRITTMPESIKVEERRVGRAVAQWILHVRCDCGRRWFEVEPVDTAVCPRCGVLVYVDMDMRRQRK